jgi:predicted cobalt transporter CbtA
LLAAAGLVAIILAPQLKYPANPPSIGNPETLGLRTALYFTMIALSVIASVAALGVGRRFASRLGDWNAALIGAAVYIVLVSIAMLALPPINEAPADYSADVLWKFRVASLGIQLVLWTTLGLVFGALADRLFAVGSRNGSPKRFAKSA